MRSKPVPAALEVSTPRLIHFGVFTADLYTHELYKRDRKVKLQEKPFQVLEMLLQRPGEIVTRTEFCKTLWSPGTFVDFDHNLKTAVRRVREALDDSADSPRYIETLASRGYRFIAPVQRLNRCQRPPLGDLTGKVRLAVLPLDHPRHDADLDEFFSDGMTDAAISQLGCLQPKQLGVIARTSVMRYKHTEKTIAQIGQELDVDYILEGGIRRAGSLVRISVRLVQVSDETLVWAGSYDRELANNAPALQRSVALCIACSPEIAALAAAESREELANSVHESSAGNERPGEIAALAAAESRGEVANSEPSAGNERPGEITASAAAESRQGVADSVHKSSAEKQNPGEAGSFRVLATPGSGI